MMGRKTLETMIQEGAAKAEGNAKVLGQLGATMATFTPDFEMVPGTAPTDESEDWNPYQAGIEAVRGESRRTSTLLDRDAAPHRRTRTLPFSRETALGFSLRWTPAP